MPSIFGSKPYGLKRLYKLVSKVENVEEVYSYNVKEYSFSDIVKKKVCVIVKNDEIGKRIYEVIKALRGEEFHILSTSRTLNIEFTKYSSSWNRSIKWFCIETFIENREHQTKLDNLKEMQEFVNSMAELGLVLDDTRFDFSKCDSISEFLSFFIKSEDSEKIKRSKGLMIEYIHYVLSDGGNLNEFYENLVKQKIFWQASELPYNLSIAKMCFNYFKSGDVPDNILHVLYDNNASLDSYYLITIPEKLESELKVTEKTDEYTIYDGNIKIYTNVSNHYSFFLQNIALTSRTKRETLEYIDKIIVDFNHHIVGYTFINQEEREMKSILDVDFNSQERIVDYVSNLVKYIRIFNDGSSTLCTDFEIEKSIICKFEKLTTGGVRYNFKIKTIKDCFNLKLQNKYTLQRQITDIFFKLLAKYITKQYGELTSKKQFLEKAEIRYLSPIIANEFIDFVLKKPVHYGEASEALFAFLDNIGLGNILHTLGNAFYYDRRFCYNPLKTVFIFDYEAENKYGVNISERKSKDLPDGRKLILFDTSKRISRFKEKEDALLKEITAKFGQIEDNHIEFVGISALIINSKNLNSDNMYNIVGYITTPIKGKQLTMGYIRTINNKDMLKVAAYLFSKFNGYHYISWNSIWMDEEFKFYINYLDEQFTIQKKEQVDEGRFIKWAFNELIKAGYNLYAFMDVNIPDKCSIGELRQYLLDCADSFDAYCDEHKVYYNSGRVVCPACRMTKYFVPVDYEKTFTKVFEDSIATHYSIDEEFNLKIYKPTCEKLDQIEENVNRLVKESLIICKVCYLFQDGFIPRKIAYDSNKQFIGLVYKAEKFENINGNTENVCMDLGDLEMLMNLPRVKSLKRFYMQINEIVSHNISCSFIMNPFTHVFLNTSYKRQVQILNIEFLIVNEANLKNTKKWALDYICKILRLDSTIEINIHNSWDSIISDILYAEKHLTKYCVVHKQYYFDTYAYCPKCLNPEAQQSYIEHRRKSTFEEKSYLDEGGESIIYAYGDDCVAKVFKEEEVNIDFKCAVLFRIFSKKDILERINKEHRKFRYVIPQKLFIDANTNKIFGYKMERVRDAYAINILKDKAKVEELGFSKTDIFEILITIGEGIEILHNEANIYIGDLNGKNILFDRDKNVYFLDFDGMGVDEIKPEFCTDGYIDPISKNNRNITKGDDWYSFAVQAFHYLTYTHPFNGIYYAVNNGHRVALEIPEKMAKRISLLGGHGMKPPEIAIPWDWMTEELKSVFLKIFEGDYRESIVQTLKTQYKALIGSFEDSKASNQIYRINLKFIATELNVFDGNVVKIFSPDAALCEKDDGRHIICFPKTFNRPKMNLVVPSIDEIYYISLSADKKMAFLFYYNRGVRIIDIENEKEIHSGYMLSSTTCFDVDENALYYNGIQNEEHVIYKRDISLNGDVVEETIKTGNQKLYYFHVEHASKFILVKRVTELKDEVYCNSEKFFEIDYSNRPRTRKYSIKYDKITKSWIVVNSNGFVLVILKDGEKIELELEAVNEVNRENISYINGRIYIPGENCLTIVNVKTKNVKKMECDKIMTPESKICDVNSEGFSVITQNNFWQVRRG